jgi:hypothetical protein
MLVMTEEGVLEVGTKVEGAEKVLDHLSHVDIPAVLKILDDPDIRNVLKTDKKFWDNRVNMKDQTFPVDVMTDLIGTMERIPTKERESTSNRLKHMITY